MMDSPAAIRLVAEALKPGAGGPAAAERRRALNDWTAPIAVANRHLLAPALYFGLREAEALADVPSDARAYLAYLGELNRARNAAFRRQALELIRALNDAGIEPMLLKGGVSLFVDIYRDTGARLFRDLDMVVAPSAATRTREALADLGYAVATRYPLGHHAYADFTRAGDPGAIDVHFELIDAKYVLPAREVWDGAQPMRVAGAEFFIPSPNHCLLHNLLHEQIHYLGNFYRGVLELRQLYEFAALARHFGPAVDWRFIAERMARHRLEVPLECYLLAAERLFGLRWPLDSRPSLGARINHRRCMTQLSLPALTWVAAPWSNIRGGFARHRLDALYYRSGPPQMARHAAQFLRKKTMSGVVNRLFRVR